MFKTLKMKNFRKHTDSTFTFQEGLSVLRGANEQGKTTMFEALAYALFGVKALRDPLENVVTWGCPLGTLRVTLDFNVEGVDYSVTRGKSGAELTYPGEIVTGQTEVSNFVAKILRVDAATAARLALSPQSEIRGALEAGTKATTELIERLAEFSKIDELIELMQEKLSLGSSAGIEASIAAAEDALAKALENTVPVDVDTHHAKIAAATAVVADLTKHLNEAELKEAYAQEVHSAARERVVARAGLVESLKNLQVMSDRIMEKLVEKQRVQPLQNAEGRIEELTQQISAAEKIEEIKAAFSQVQKFTKRETSITYEGTTDELDAEIQVTKANKGTCETRIATLKGEMNLLKQKLVQGTCTFCGKDFSGVPEVETANIILRTEIANVEDKLGHESRSLAALSRDLVSMEKIKRDSVPALTALRMSKGYGELADNELPPILKWVGPDARAANADIKALNLEIADIRRRMRLYDEAAAVIPLLESQLDDAQKQKRAVQKQINDTPVENLESTQEALDIARAISRGVSRDLMDAKQVLSDTSRALRDAQAMYDAAVKVADASKTTLKQAQEALENLAFNNALLKRIRQCRPAISDKLWSVVLVATSSYFSEMRGVRSEVTKDASGFLVDGHPITSLSGSTLDILGLAVRIALVRTFLPNLQFLLLDEPCAAADADRTASTVGFLSACGFRQTILCSHENISQDVADHVILLGD